MCVCMGVRLCVCVCGGRVSVYVCVCVCVCVAHGGWDGAGHNVTHQRKWGAHVCAGEAGGGAQASGVCKYTE